MNRSCTLAMVGFIAVILAPAAVAQEAGDGEAAFNTNCRQCHSMKKDDNRLGPSLFGIFGKKGGEVKGFTNYSGAMNAFTWDEATLDKFIENPRALASSTTMIYPGLSDKGTRAKIIAFLKSRSN